jgi:hypothetical protein
MWMMALMADFAGMVRVGYYSEYYNLVEMG